MIVLRCTEKLNFGFLKAKLTGIHELITDCSMFYVDVYYVDVRLAHVSPNTAEETETSG